MGTILRRFLQSYQFCVLLYSMFSRMIMPS
eukprot:SAG11_NODE_134_length_15338_cov_3.876435_22_plen_30_part_00